MWRTLFLFITLTVAPAVTLIPACESTGTALEERSLRVGCGTCQFGAHDHPGCYWAAEVDGRVVPMGGPGIPQDHDDHGPEGICNVTRQAVVTGTLHDEHVAVTHLELGPIEESSRSAAAHPHRH